MFNTVFIIPTGIGASIGGHAGDATPAFKLIASLSDIAITHPNVVNASDINEMPENTWYVEGSMLDRFLWGEIKLKKPHGNKILLITNKPIQPETINAINAARNTIGCEIEWIELEEEFNMTGTFDESGVATGEHTGVHNLLKQIDGHEFDALAMATRITVPKEVALNYFRNGGINPWGGIEAIVSKAIANRIDKPFAHAPVETEDKELKTFNEIVDPRIAAELVSCAYIHCVFKGLHKAPRISTNGLSFEDIDCLITPLGCCGPPHLACEENEIPIIAVEENTTCLTEQTPYTYLAKTYIEAAGIIQLIRTGMDYKILSHRLSNHT